MTETAAMERRVICRIDDIEDGGSGKKSVTVKGEDYHVMVIRQGGKAFVYYNSCPHIGAPLDYTPGKFMAPDGQHIMCSNHGAMFRIHDGYGISGPCTGTTLTAVPIHIEDGVVYHDPA